jgi:hypothetical protein
MKEHEMGNLPLGMAFRRVVVVPRILVSGCFGCLLGHVIFLLVLLHGRCRPCKEPAVCAIFRRASALLKLRQLKKFGMLDPLDG